MFSLLHSPLPVSTHPPPVDHLCAPTRDSLTLQKPTVVQWRSTQHTRSFDHSPATVSQAQFCRIGDAVAVAAMLSSGELRIHTETGAIWDVPMHASIAACLPASVGGGLLMQSPRDGQLFHLPHPLDPPVPVLARPESVLWVSPDDSPFPASLLTFDGASLALYLLRGAPEPEPVALDVLELNFDSGSDDASEAEVASAHLDDGARPHGSAAAAAARLELVLAWRSALDRRPEAAFCAHSVAGAGLVCTVHSGSLFGAAFADGAAGAFQVQGTREARSVQGAAGNAVDILRLTGSTLELLRGDCLLCVLDTSALPAPISRLGAASGAVVDVLLADGSWTRGEVRARPLGTCPAVSALLAAAERVDAGLGLALAVDVEVWRLALAKELGGNVPGELSRGARRAARNSLAGSTGASEVNDEWAAAVLLLSQLLQPRAEAPAGAAAAKAHEEEGPWAALLGSSYHLALAAEHPALLPGSRPAASASLQQLPLPRACTPPCSLSRRFATPAALARLAKALQLEFEDFKLNVLKHPYLVRLGELCVGLARATWSHPGCAALEDYMVRELGPARFPLERIVRLPAAVSPAPGGDVAASAAAAKGEEAENVMEILQERLGMAAARGAARVAEEEELGGGLWPRRCRQVLGLADALRSRGPPALGLALAACDAVELDTLPVGVALVFSEALFACREAPPADWPPEAYALIGRTDLVEQRRHLEQAAVVSTLDSADDVAADSPVDSPPSGTGLERVVKQSALRFGRDRRVEEVCRLLNTGAKVKFSVERRPEMTDHDLVEAQQVKLRTCVERGLAGAPGRGALTLFTLPMSGSLVAEPIKVPALSLVGWTGKKVEVRLHSELSTTWPGFHNGVAAGLEHGPGELRENLLRTWILFNKPAAPSDEHAGVLLALGLLGHLRCLTMADTYEHLAPGHDPTTVGLLVGLGAARAGSGDAAVSKTLCLHVPALLPPAFHELDVGAIVQTAALAGLGLLHRGTGHRLMCEFLVDELGALPSSDKAVDDREAHALAAGLALGMVGLGLGARPQGLVGLADLLLEDRLQVLMEGGERARPGEKARASAAAHPSSSASVGMASAQAMAQAERESMIACARLLEGSGVNTDVTAPGATLALGLLFLKSGNQAVADRLRVPNTLFALDLVRPDHLTLRVWARALVLWNGVEPTRAWVDACVPACLAVGGLAGGLAAAGEPQAAGMDEARDCIVAGACLGMGTRFAGTLCRGARDVLLEVLGELTSRARPWPKHFETCVALVALSLAVVVAGSGDLACLKALRALRVAQLGYGPHMAVGMGLGFLFLGAGRYSFKRTNEAVACLVCALTPPFPHDAADNSCHLQALRHLYVLAAEKRVVETLDAETLQPCYAPLLVEVDLRGTGVDALCEQVVSPELDCAVDGPRVVAPCLLPPLEWVRSVAVASDRFWPAKWPAGPHLLRPLCVKRRAYQLAYDIDPLGLSGLFVRPETVTMQALQRVLKDFFPTLGAFCALFDDHAELVYRTLMQDRVDTLALQLELRAPAAYPLDAWQVFFENPCAPPPSVALDLAQVKLYFQGRGDLGQEMCMELAKLGVPSKHVAFVKWGVQAKVVWGLLV